jgi:hypothetical protein
MIEKRVNIRMKETARGAEDHVNNKMYEQGKIYEVAESLAEVFIGGKLAEEVKPKKKAEPEETKVVEPKEKKKDK